MFLATLKKWIWFSELNDIDLALDNLNKIKFSDFNKVFSSYYSIIRIKACWSTATQYILALKHINRCVEENLDLDLKRINHIPIEVKLLDFYRIRDGLYSPINTTEEFITEAKSFLLAFDRINNKENKNFNDERFIRLTKHLVSDILNISKELVRV